MPEITPGSRIQDLTSLVARLASSGRDRLNNLTGRIFSPQVPLQPNTNAQEQTGGPRQYVYPTSANLIVRPRHEYPDLPTFDQLRNLARMYDIAALCVGKRCEQLSNLEWSIAARNKKEQEQFEKSGAIVFATKFFQKPDRLNRFSSWIKKAGRDVLEIDALSIYVRRTNGGKLYGLELVDGSSVKPLIDDRGRVLAYQQIIYGIPGSNYIRYGVDTESEIIPIDYPGFEGDEWPQEMMYLPYNERTDNPYGLSPTEFVLMRVNMALRKQTFDMAYFTDGNIPDMLLNPPEGMMNVDQVAAFEEWFNAVLEGNDAMRRKARFLAWPANVQQLKPFSYETTLDEWMMKLTCAAYGITPSEIGFTDDVNRATAESQENVQYRGIWPLAKFFKELFDEVLANEFNLPGLEWQWKAEEVDDTLKQAQTDHIYLVDGVLSPDEVRAIRFSGVVEGPAPGKPQQQQPNGVTSGSGVNVPDPTAADNSKTVDAQAVEIKPNLATPDNANPPEQEKEPAKALAGPGASRKVSTPKKRSTKARTN